MALHQCLGFDHGLLVDVVDSFVGWVYCRKKPAKESV
jgi:hypothetical protein